MTHLFALVALASSVAFTPRAHTLTHENLFESPQQIGQPDFWTNAKRYLDQIRAPRGTMDGLVRAAGIPSVAYTDPNLCAGSYAVGGTPYAAPDCSTADPSAFYSQSGNVLTGSYNGVVQQRFGNPSSSALRSAELATVTAALGNGDYDLVEIDDAGTMNEYYGGALCWGLGSFTGGYSCAGALGGSAYSPWGNYTFTSWVAGEEALAAALPRKVFFNGLQSTSAYGPAEPRASITAAIVASPNAWGGMCETCGYTASNKWTMTSPILDQRLQGMMDVLNVGKSVIVVNGWETDSIQREAGLAFTMLVYRPDKVWEEGDPCGTISHIHVCPEASLTFYAPYKPFPKTPADLATTAGVYVREFAACYNTGKRIGPCAAVVNPDPYNAHAMPALHNSYAHTVAIAGTSLCQCYGDSGSVDESGPAAPSMVPAASGWVVFQ